MNESTIKAIVKRVCVEMQRCSPDTIIVRHYGAHGVRELEVPDMITVAEFLAALNGPETSWVEGEP